MVQFELEIATLKAYMRKSMGACKDPCQMAKSQELKSQEQRVVLNVENILGVCMSSKSIIIQDAKIKEMILKLQKNPKKSFMATLVH